MYQLGSDKLFTLVRWLPRACVSPTADMVNQLCGKRPPAAPPAVTSLPSRGQSPTRSETLLHFHTRESCNEMERFLTNCALDAINGSFLGVYPHLYFHIIILILWHVITVTPRIQFFKKCISTRCFYFLKKVHRHQHFAVLGILTGL